MCVCACVSVCDAHTAPPPTPYSLAAPCVCPLSLRQSSSILMSYVGACPHARSDLTRPAVPAEVCEARIQGALSCANDVLNRQTFAFMPPRDTLRVRCS